MALSGTRAALLFQTRQGADMVVPYGSQALAQADSTAISVAQTAGKRVFITTTDGMTYEIAPNRAPEVAVGVLVTPS